MSLRSAPAEAFDQVRPRLLALLEMHRAATTDDARTRVASAFEAVFLASAWHVATDLLENGWRPPAPTGPSPSSAVLRLVGGTDIGPPPRASRVR